MNGDLESNLKEIEKKAYRSQFEDGLTDMLLAFLFISLAIGQLGTLFGEPDTLYFLIIYGISYSIGFALTAILKRKFVIPHVGKAKFGVKRKRRKIWLALTTLIFFIFTLILFIINLPGIPLEIDFPLEGFTLLIFLATVFMFLPFAFIAYFLDFPRMYIIAIMGFFGLFFLELLNPIMDGPYHFFIILGTIGLIILTWSIVLFYRFLKKHPLQGELLGNTMTEAEGS